MSYLENRTHPANRTHMAKRCDDGTHMPSKKWGKFEHKKLDTYDHLAEDRTHMTISLRIGHI